MKSEKERLIEQIKKIKKPLPDKGYVSKSMMQIVKEQEKKNSGNKK